MRYFAALDVETLLYLLGDEPFSRLKIMFLAGSRSLKNRLIERGHTAKSGDITDQKFYRSLHISSDDSIILHVPDPARQKKVVKSIHAVAPEAPLLILSDHQAAYGEAHPSVRQVTFPSMSDGGLVNAVNDLHNQIKMNRIRNVLEDADKVIILLQNDPDPDAMAGGLALRTLIGRNRATALLTTLGSVERPENLAMLRLLDIQVRPFSESDLRGNNKLAMVDVQPPISAISSTKSTS